MPKRRLSRIFTALALLVCLAVRAHAASAFEAHIASEAGMARLFVEEESPFRVRLTVDPWREKTPISLHAEVPETGPKTWPLDRVQVLDADGRRLPVRRDGLSWQILDFTVPPTRAQYIVCLADPPTHRPIGPLPPETKRTAVDAESGVSVSISRWPGGHRAALSLRFDDSHPTHLSKVVPILDDYGFKGTFMVNPGSDQFRSHEMEWKALARKGRHELANHTMNHRGASDDEETARAIGDASKYLWGLSPNRSKLLALNLGGGTKWTTAAPFSDYLDRYHLFHVTGSLGMDDVYGNRPAALRSNLARHVERGLWCRVHFHSVGDGLASSEANFRAALDVVRAHASDVWVAGMADVYKYQEERKAAKLSLSRDAAGRIVLDLACLSNADLYDQPLAVELLLPEGWAADGTTLTAEDGGAVAPSGAGSRGSRPLMRFDLPPATARYVIDRAS
ncbi:MAG: polysaccharide deacetylase family protein [bacterium]|nr:polysaccharide deacetylase family protein [bacterium]